LALFGGVCNSDGGVGDGILDFESSASAVFELFVDFGPSERRQDTVVEPLLCWFRFLSGNAGLGGGLRARMAARTLARLLLLPVTRWTVGAILAVCIATLKRQRQGPAFDALVTADAGHNPFSPRPGDSRERRMTALSAPFLCIHTYSTGP
jgi:hypothetical protein